MEFFGTDPDETVEVDVGRYVLESRVKTRKEELEAAKPEEKENAVKALADAEAALAAHQPGGFTVTVGHIEETAWAKIEAKQVDARKIPLDTGAAVEPAHEWQREIVKWGLRGHSGLKTKAGRDLAYGGAEVQLNGKARVVASDTTLELYFASKILSTIANIVFRRQVLGDELKNG